MPNLNELFGQLENKIITFLNKLLGSIVTSTLRTWTSVPIKLGRTAMPNPTTTRSQNYQTSVCQCSHLLQALKGRVQFDNFRHKECVIEVRTEHRKNNIVNANELLGNLSSDLSTNEKRRVKYLQEKGTGTWLVA